MAELREKKLLVERELGRGAFGRAILVKSLTDGRQYVAKEVNLAGMKKRDIDDSRNEVSVMASLNHPNITRFVESFETSNKLYTIMEYADGGDLAVKIRRSKRAGSMPTDIVLSIFIQICLALKYLHEKKYLHRDIKTQNVFLSSSDIVKLGDFGVAKHVGSIGEANTVCGTYSYFSPEMCRRSTYSSKSDVFALGVLLYETLTLGKKPFVGKDVPGLLSNIEAGKQVPIPSDTGHPPELISMCNWMLTNNAENRPSIQAILASPYMQTELKEFAKNQIDKGKTFQKFKQQQISAKSEGSSGSGSGLGKKLFGGLFSKRKQSGMSNSALSASQKTDTAVKIDKATLGEMLKNAAPGKIPEPAQDSRQAAGTAAPPSIQTCETTLRDCKFLAKLAASPHKDNGAKPVVDSPERAEIERQRTAEILTLQIGMEKTQTCVSIIQSWSGESDSELHQKITEIIGGNNVPLIPFIIQHCSVSLTQAPGDN